MNYLDRILRVYSESGYKSFSAFEEHCGYSSNSLKKTSNPTREKIELLWRAYPQYRLEWLLFGDGEPYVQRPATTYDMDVEEPSQTVQEDDAIPYNTHPHAHELIEELRARIHALEQLSSAKDKVIAAKDEVIALYRQQLASATGVTQQCDPPSPSAQGVTQNVTQNQNQNFPNSTTNS